MSASEIHHDIVTRDELRAITNTKRMLCLHFSGRAFLFLYAFTPIRRRLLFGLSKRASFLWVTGNGAGTAFMLILGMWSGPRQRTGSIEGVASAVTVALVV